MSGTCSTNGNNEKRLDSLGQKGSRNERTWEWETQRGCEGVGLG